MSSRRILLSLLASLVFCSCAPQLASLPHIPKYALQPVPCRKPAVCALEVRRRPSFRSTKYVLVARTGNSDAVLIPGEPYPGSAELICKLALQKRFRPQFSDISAKFADREGWLADKLSRDVSKIADVRNLSNRYITRQTRLEVGRLITVDAIQWRILLGRDGTFTDALVTVSVRDLNAPTDVLTFTSWGRAKTDKNSINMEAALDDAFANLIRTEDFSRSLELP